MNEVDFFETTCTVDTECDTAAHANAVCAVLNVTPNTTDAAGDPETTMRCKCPDGLTFSATGDSTGVCGEFYCH